MENLITKMQIILDDLKIKAKCTFAKQHRHLAFFDIKLLLGTKIRKIESFSREIGLALKSKTHPIITTSSEEGVVKIKVAFENAPMILLNDLKKENKKLNYILPILLGETDTGNPFWIDMAHMPHMLVGGGTGSGKSTFLHVLIANVISYSDVQIYLGDPKQGVEFGIYKDKAKTIATDYNEIVFMLENLKYIMETRYTILEKVGLRSIEQNPKLFKKILVVIDEVADIMLMDSNKKNPKKGHFEDLICNLAAKARAAGIYIVLATQRPSVDVITGSIRANFPARLACKVSSGIDSKVILDQQGAEHLLGRGDAILRSPKHDFVRFQVAYVKPENVISAAA